MAENGMQNSLKKLTGLAEAIAELDARILEIFIHADSRKDPLAGEEIYLVSHLAEPSITNDIEVYDEAAVDWSLDMGEAISPLLDEQGIEQEVILTPFNYRLHERGEYGSFYVTLFIKKGYRPILEIADELKRKKDRQILDSLNGQTSSE